MSVLSQFFGKKNVVKFTSSGTWNVPQGVQTVTILACGGGGGGSGVGDGGGGGQVGYWIDLPVDGVTSFTITIGAGGSSGSPGGTTVIQGGPYRLVCKGGGAAANGVGGTGGGSAGMAVPPSMAGTNGAPYNNSADVGNAFYSTASNVSSTGGSSIGSGNGPSGSGVGYGGGGGGSVSTGRSGVVFILY